MESRLPLIGIPADIRTIQVSGSAWLSLRPSYVQAVIRAGGAPVILPLTDAETVLAALFEQLDGVLLAGGGDVQPALYSAEQSQHVKLITPERDRVEQRLIAWALERDLPLLAICRGHQMLNVALGGTLIQDIPSERPAALRHDHPADAGFFRLSHDIHLDRTSRLYSVLQPESPTLAVNSLHHQAIDRTADRLQIVARADDQIIEAVEMPDSRFVFGVQWHPETLIDQSPVMLRLFEEFVQAANGQA